MTMEKAIAAAMQTTTDIVSQSVRSSGRGRARRGSKAAAGTAPAGVQYSSGAVCAGGTGSLTSTPQSRRHGRPHVGMARLHVPVGADDAVVLRVGRRLRQVVLSHPLMVLQRPLLDPVARPDHACQAGGRR